MSPIVLYGVGLVLAIQIIGSGLVIWLLNRIDRR